MNTNTRVHDCGVHNNHSLALLFAIPPFVATIGSDTTWLLQNKIPVMIQSSQPTQSIEQQLQQSVTNGHVIRDTVLREHPLYRITSVITSFTLFISHLHSNVNEPYGRVVHPAHNDTSTVNPDDDHLDSTNGPQAIASSNGGNDDDDEDDPFNRKLHMNRCGGDESLANEHDADQDNNHEYHKESGFIGEPVDVFGSDNLHDFPNIVLDDDMDIDGNNMVEVGVVDEEEEEDMVGLWEE